MSPEGQNCPQVRIPALAPWGVSPERKLMEQREDVTLWAGLSFGRKEPGDGDVASQPFQPPGPVHTLELLLLLSGARPLSLDFSHNPIW